LEVLGSAIVLVFAILGYEKWHSVGEMIDNAVTNRIGTNVLIEIEQRRKNIQGYEVAAADAVSGMRALESQGKNAVAALETNNVAMLLRRVYVDPSSGELFIINGDGVNGTEVTIEYGAGVNNRHINFDKHGDIKCYSGQLHQAKYAGEIVPFLAK
jgi:hypothetical protein